MFENILNIFKKIGKKEERKQAQENSKNAAKERLHLVLMQDRANVSADFLELMKQEIIDVIKKYIEIDEKEIDVRLTNKENEDGTNGAPALYANIPILNIKNDTRKISKKDMQQQEETNVKEKNKETEIKQKTNKKEKEQKEIKEDKAKIKNKENKPNEDIEHKDDETTKNEKVKKENENKQEENKSSKKENTEDKEKQENKDNKIEQKEEVKSEK